MKNVTVHWLLFAGLGLIALITTGCAGSRHSRSPANPLEESFTLPPFLTGPVATLLTNAHDFSAHMVVEFPSSSAKPRTITGNFLEQGARLLFSSTVGDRTFVWDVTQNSGLILSEALQGYAPISSPVRITSVMENAGPAGPILDSANGIACHRTEALISSSDGSKVRFTVWRAVGANAFPVKIKSITEPTQLTINLFDARREILSQNLFLPPVSFTKYTSASGMRDELAMRQKSVNKKAPDEPISGIGHGGNPYQMSR